MKTVHVLLALCISLSVYGQRDLSGTYDLKDAYGIKIVVDGNNFYYIDGGLPLRWLNDTLAHCTIRWVDKDFIELTSVETSNMRIVQKKDSLSRGSKFIFRSPYTLGELDMTVWADGRAYPFKWTGDKEEFTLPDAVKRVKFTINAKGIEHELRGIFYGRLFYASPDFELDEGMNLFEVDMSMIDNSFFEKYYLRKEYARVKGKKIIWKGETYVRR